MLSQTRKTLTHALRAAAVTVPVLAACPFLPSAANAAGTTPAHSKATPPATPAPALAPASSAPVPVDFAAIVDRYGPAVVNITATTTEQPTPGPVTLEPDNPVLTFFKRSAPQFQESQGGLPRVIIGIGSGFIVSPDGTILTAGHVVDRAEDVSVKLTDGREFKAKVLAVDAQSDVAVVKIDTTKLPTVKLGDSSRVRAGESVLTIGSPYAFENTVTSGIVSVTPRALPDDNAIPVIETDVATHPDNSGGPLFNRYGEVIGINVQTYAPTERFQSLTFAIPINVATRVQTQLLSQEKGARSSVGVGVQDVDPGLARAFGLRRPAGALVNFVEPGTPAAAGGLKAGDIVVQMDDKPIERSAELVEQLANLKPGTKTTLTLVRDRKPMTVTVAAGAGASASLSEEKPAARQAESNAAAADRLGLAVRPLNDAERQASGLAEGLMVDGVYGPAASAGIQPGDIILSLNGTPVRTKEQLGALTARAGKQVALLILHDSNRIFVSIEVR